MLHHPFRRHDIWEELYCKNFAASETRGVESIGGVCLCQQCKVTHLLSAGLEVCTECCRASCNDTERAF